MKKSNEASRRNGHKVDKRLVLERKSKLTSEDCKRKQQVQIKPKIVAIIGQL
jgi:hypothetical protein